MVTLCQEKQTKDTRWQHLQPIKPQTKKFALCSKILACVVQDFGWQPLLCCVPAAGEWKAAAPRRRPGRGSHPPSASRCGWSAAGWCCRAWRSFHTGPAASAPPGTELGRLRRRQERGRKTPVWATGASVLFPLGQTLLRGGGGVLWKLGNVSSEYCILGHSDCNLNSNARILKIFKLFALGTQKKNVTLISQKPNALVHLSFVFQPPWGYPRGTHCLPLQAWAGADAWPAADTRRWWDEAEDTWMVEQKTEELWRFVGGAPTPSAAFLSF